MRILHVIPSLSSAHGGPSAALPLMERALTEVGVEIETATTNDDGPGQTNAKLLETPLEENGVRRWYFAKRIEFYKYSPGLRRWLRNAVEWYDIVHIHALFSYPSIAAAQVARAAGVPYVIRPLGVLNRYGITQRRARLKALSLRFFESSLLRDAAAVHFASISEKLQAESLGIPMRCEVIPLGINVPSRIMNGACRVRSVLCLARIDPVKNLDGLLYAWSRLASDFPKWKLQIAGDGDEHYVRQLKAMADSLGINRQLEWLGHVSGEVKARAFREASLFVLPSHSENFGIAAVEALAAGLPCVLAEGVAVGSEAAAEDACLLTSPDPASIEMGLRQLLADHDLRWSLGRRGHQFARERYSLQAMGENLKSMYQSVLSNSRN